ncbi:MAG: hypothetical protein JWM25_170 [Thermoleophilia bacterium]|nr:hypothetical protein [Thermoleophilia bacterium]MCZ4495587.1 hypothetical protein [Thermoleophilia bacterium]
MHPYDTTTPVMVCFGTRPEVIKLAPVITALDAHPELHAVNVTTAQHREMLDQALATHRITPDLDLGLMEHGQSIDGLASLAIATLGRAVRDQRPAAVVVQGDTTTALCAALAAFWLHIPVAHVEAGLRTGDLASPFPEEGNRTLIGSIARWHFCPTTDSADNLVREGVPADRIHVTGNTAVDAVQEMVRRNDGVAHLIPARRRARRLLVTMHRRETHGDVQRQLLRMLARIVAEHDVEVVLPVHPNPAVRDVVAEELGGRDGVLLLDPVEYAEFVQLMCSSDLILTDSGGMQEEAPALGVPLLVMRDTTERPEGVASGCVMLCGTDPEFVETELLRLLADPFALAAMATAPQPYGDGNAALRIADLLAAELAPARVQEPRPLQLVPTSSATGALVLESIMTGAR